MYSKFKSINDKQSEYIATNDNDKVRLYNNDKVRLYRKKKI